MIISRVLRSVLRPIRNFLGKRKGISGCLRCGDTWNWKEKHVLWGLEKAQGMFPCCEECWSQIGRAEKLRFCKMLFVSWQKLDHLTGDTTDIEDLMAQARKAIDQEISGW